MLYVCVEVEISICVHRCVGGQHAYGSKANALKTSAELLFYSYGRLKNCIRCFIDLLFRK